MIFEGSRYTKTNLYNRDGVSVFERREMLNFNVAGAMKHTVVQSDTLSTIAHHYYGDSQLWWVILEANPHYSCLFDIQIGDILLIPTREEVTANV